MRGARGVRICRGCDARRRNRAGLCFGPGRLLARVGWMLEPAGFSQGRHSCDHTDEEEEPDGYQEWKSVSHLLPPPVVFP
jgi:hypothetical protein